MGYALGNKLLNPQNVLQPIQSVPNEALPPVENPALPTTQVDPSLMFPNKGNVTTENKIIPLETPNFDLNDALVDLDLLKVLSDVENENLVAMLQLQQLHQNIL